MGVEVTFEIDANGILNVGAHDKTSGAQESITITADKGRPSQEEIDEMLRAAEEFAEEDARMAETVQAKNQLESAAYNLKNQLEDKEKQQEFDDIAQPILKDFYQQNPGAGGMGGDEDDDDSYYGDHEDL